uniref:Arginine vasopressin-induced protein 1 n=1 Tax=Acanthochromis polyacanthus TaxID=80966 RepID=A0A3Q1G7M2_9TELE
TSSHICSDSMCSTFSTEDGQTAQWKFSSPRSRKSGCSNIFTGVNLHQLQRLFRTAGDRNAEHREESGMEREDEAGLAQALVGLRVRARNKAGIRVEGHREHKWLRASGYLR